MFAYKNCCAFVLLAFCLLLVSEVAFAPRGGSRGGVIEMTDKAAAAAAADTAAAVEARALVDENK